MKANHSDLIAIANSSLAAKLDKAAETNEQQRDDVEQSNKQTLNSRAFKQDIWKAVFTLNVMRYVTAITFLVIYSIHEFNPNWNPITNFNYPGLFLLSTIALLLSAIAFSYFSTNRKLTFNLMILMQFACDLVLATLFIHACGSINSSFALLFFVVVGTGSIVLPRSHALGLAAGGIILMFYEHFYSTFKSTVLVEPQYGDLVRYSIVLFGAAWLISYLAQRLRLAELKTYIPGDETIEEFLVREEVNALKSALERTKGNKTEAAKLLGMTFRSFRYKVTKYDIA